MKEWDKIHNNVSGGTFQCEMKISQIAQLRQKKIDVGQLEKAAQ